MAERDPVKEAQYQREAEMIAEAFKRVAEAKEEQIQRILQSMRPVLESEIRATGKALRDAIQNMDADWHDAMTAIVHAANTWEDKAS